MFPALAPERFDLSLAACFCFSLEVAKMKYLSVQWKEVRGETWGPVENEATGNVKWLPRTDSHFFSASKARSSS
jgi:hypothetical protein